MSECTFKFKVRLNDCVEFIDLRVFHIVRLVHCCDDISSNNKQLEYRACWRLEVASSCTNVVWWYEGARTGWFQPDSQGLKGLNSAMGSTNVCKPSFPVLDLSHINYNKLADAYEPYQKRVCSLNSMSAGLNNNFTLKTYHTLNQAILMINIFSGGEKFECFSLTR